MTEQQPPASQPAQSPPSPPQDGRARLLYALRKRPGRAQVLVGVLLALLGFAAVTQVRSNSEDDAYVGARQDELVALINSLSLASQRTENEIEQLVSTRDSLLNDTERRRTALEQARQQADQLGILAGTLPAVGPGIRVTIDDPSGAAGSNNLINGIQELRDAGAEAIEINNTVRVVAQTALHDGPNGGVVVDGEQVDSPYVIEAIGPPHTMASGLRILRGFVDTLQEAGVKVSIEEVDDASVEISSVREAASADYAAPAPNQ